MWEGEEYGRFNTARWVVRRCECVKDRKEERELVDECINDRN